ncbi:MAG: VanZ family protein [Acholeplasmataceae bacterium]
MTKRSYIYLVLSLLMTSLIWFNSSLNAELSSIQSGFITGLIDDILKTFRIEVSSENLSFIIRKGAHFGQFFILGALWFKTFDEMKKPHIKPWVSALGIGVITAIIDESIQLYTPGRAFMVFDIIIDTLGLIAGILGVILIKQILLNRKKTGRHIE